MRGEMHRVWSWLSHSCDSQTNILWMTSELREQYQFLRAMSLAALRKLEHADSPMESRRSRRRADVAVVFVAPASRRLLAFFWKWKPAGKMPALQNPSRSAVRTMRYYACSSVVDSRAGGGQTLGHVTRRKLAKRWTRA